MFFCACLLAPKTRKKGLEGLKGATFVNGNGKTGTVSNVYEEWDFTLEVELDKWRVGSRSGAKLYLPVRRVHDAIGVVLLSSPPSRVDRTDVRGAQ